MTRNVFVLYALLFGLLLTSACSSVKSSRQPENISESKPGSTVNLFNGNDLSGWYTFIKDRGRDTDPKKVFQVHDGLLHVSGEEYGCITTNKEYSNYKLLAEFKWGDKTFPPRVSNARDNGILIHSTGKDGGYSGTWMHSIECQIIEGGTGDFLVVGDNSAEFALSSPVAAEKQNGTYIFKPGGSLATIHGGRINWYGRDPDWKDVLGFRGKNDIEKPAGEWNRMECIANNDKISIFVNGTLVNQAVNVKPASGRIQVQSEGAEIFFRRIELTPLNTN